MNEAKNKISKVVRKSITADHYDYARETWRALGGGEKYLTRERKSRGNYMNRQRMSRIQVHFPKSLRDWLKLEAAKRKIGISTLAREIIIESLKKPSISKADLHSSGTDGRSDLHLPAIHFPFQLLA